MYRSWYSQAKLKFNEPTSKLWSSRMNDEVEQGTYIHTHSRLLASSAVMSHSLPNFEPRTQRYACSLVVLSRTLGLNLRDGGSISILLGDRVLDSPYQPMFFPLRNHFRLSSMDRPIHDCDVQAFHWQLRNRIDRWYPHERVPTNLNDQAICMQENSSWIYIFRI